MRNLARMALKQQQGGKLDLALRPGAVTIKHPELEGEVVVGGVFVKRYLEEPEFPLRAPKRFLEHLLEQIVQEGHKTLQLFAAGKADAAKPEAVPEAQRTSMLCEAVTALLRVQPLLADHAVQIAAHLKLCGLLGTWVGFATAGAEKGPRAVLLLVTQILHQLTTNLAVNEGLASATLALPRSGGSGLDPPATFAASRPGEVFVTVVKGTLAPCWGEPAHVLALEALQRALAREVRGRGLLVAECDRLGLVPLLVARLDWKAGPAAVQEQQSKSTALVAAATTGTNVAAIRVLALGVLRLLILGHAADPPTAHSQVAAKIHAALEGNAAWKSQSNQRHDLFLPGAANQARGGAGVAGLLQGTGAGGQLSLTDGS